MNPSLIENYFSNPVYNPERFGCDFHKDSGALETEILVSCPDFILVHIGRIVTVFDDGELRYFRRTEECDLPNKIHLPTTTGKQLFELYCVIEWHGVASPTTGRSTGHYTAFVRIKDQWYHMDDNSVKKIHIRALTRKGYICGYTKLAL